MFVKICGITREADARAAVGFGASAIGFIFWPRSPRYIEPAQARLIVTSLPPFVTPVGVFVNQPADHVNEVADRVGLGVVQLHGDEEPGMLDAIRRPVLKAIGKPGADAAARWPDRAMLLVDADDRDRRGGTGEKADWSEAARLAATRRILLAGGITAANVVAAVSEVRPFGIDVSSGVEASPGVKDVDRMRQLFEALGGWPRL